VNEGELLSFIVSATDADTDPITYGTNATKGSFDTITGNFSWTPAMEMGEHTFGTSIQATATEDKTAKRSQ